MRVSNGGVNNPSAKLTWEKVDKIRAMCATGNYSHRQLAKLFNANTGTISYIVRHKQWREVDRNAKTKSQIAAEVVMEYPHVGYAQLARYLAKHFPTAFPKFQVAYSAVRRVRGSHGEQSRRNARDKSLFLEEA